MAKWGFKQESVDVVKNILTVLINSKKHITDTDCLNKVNKTINETITWLDENE